MSKEKFACICCGKRISMEEAEHAEYGLYQCKDAQACVKRAHQAEEFIVVDYPTCSKCGEVISTHATYHTKEEASQDQCATCIQEEAPSMEDIRADIMTSTWTLEREDI